MMRRAKRRVASTRVARLLLGAPACTAAAPQRRTLQPGWPAYDTVQHWLWPAWPVARAGLGCCCLCGEEDEEGLE